MSPSPAKRELATPAGESGAAIDDFDAQTILLQVCDETDAASAMHHRIRGQLAYHEPGLVQLVGP